MRSAVGRFQIIIGIVVVVTAQARHVVVRGHRDVNVCLPIPSNGEILGFNHGVDAHLVDMDGAQGDGLNVVLEQFDVVDQDGSSADEIDRHTVVFDEDILRADLSTGSTRNVLGENAKEALRILGHDVLALAWEVVVQPVERLIVCMTEDRARLRTGHLLAGPRATPLAGTILAAMIVLKDALVLEIGSTIVLARALIRGNAGLLIRCRIEKDLTRWTGTTGSVRRAIVVRHVIGTRARASSGVQRVDLCPTALLVFE